jgi:hypothetical protein
MQRELAERENAGVSVTLHWDKGTGSLRVSVRDSLTGEAFDLEANENDALDVFRHPYAYAAHRQLPAIAASKPVSA